MIKRFDFVERDGTTYLVVMREASPQLPEGLELWDFRAWAWGYYDAYIPIEGTDISKLTVVGNLTDNPELLPPECDGYNGEPSTTILETIWVNPAFNEVKS